MFCIQLNHHESCEMKLFMFQYIHTDQSTESEVNLSVSIFEKAQTIKKMVTLNLKLFF